MDMLTTTLSFENMHKHGELMVNLLKARKQSFIVQNNWDLPEVAGMEYDQYDTPASCWIAVHEGEKVLAGVRLTPTTARCGMYSYMVRDAQKGMLESIPSNLLYDEAPIDPGVLDASRVFVAREVSFRTAHGSADPAYGKADYDCQGHGCQAGAWIGPGYLASVDQAPRFGRRSCGTRHVG